MHIILIVNSFQVRCDLHSLLDIDFLNSVGYCIIPILIFNTYVQLITLVKIWIFWISNY